MNGGHGGQPCSNCRVHKCRNPGASSHGCRLVIPCLAPRYSLISDLRTSIRRTEYYSLIHRRHFFAAKCQPGLLRLLCDSNRRIHQHPYQSPSWSSKPCQREFRERFPAPTLRPHAHLEIAGGLASAGRVMPLKGLAYCHVLTCYSPVN